MEATVSEQTILEALHRIPAERWGEVLRLMDQLGASRPTTLTAAELARSDVAGIWADREDIGDTREFARRLRRQAETRGRATDDARH